MATLSQASSPLNCQRQRSDSVQKPRCFSWRVPSGSPVAFHEPIRSLKAWRASLGLRWTGASADARCAGTSKDSNAKVFSECLIPRPSGGSVGCSAPSYPFYRRMTGAEKALPVHMDWALQGITQKKSKRIKKSVAWGLLVNLLKKGCGQCRKKKADPANHVLPDPGPGMLTPKGRGREIRRERACFLRWKACGRRGPGLRPKLILLGRFNCECCFLVGDVGLVGGTSRSAAAAAPSTRACVFGMLQHRM